MTNRITPEEVEQHGTSTRSGHHLEYHFVEAVFMRRLAAQMRADAERLAAAEADAAQWRALQAVSAHPMARGPGSPFLDKDGWNAFARHYGCLFAPTPVELLAKLDALMPKPERWRFPWNDIRISGWSTPTAEDARKAASCTGQGKGHPVRELRNPAGDTLYLREGRPVPTEGGPWE